MKTNLFNWSAGAALLGAAVLIHHSLESSPPPFTASGGGTHISKPGTSRPVPLAPGVRSKASQSNIEAREPLPHLAEAARLANQSESLAKQAAITAWVASLTDPNDCALIAADLSTYGHSLVGAALERWVELDPQGAIRSHALKIDHREARVGCLEWMFRDYGAQDALTAFVFAKTLEGIGETERQTSIAATLGALAKVDPVAACKALAELQASVAFGAATEVYGTLSKSRPADELFDMASQLPGVARSTALQAILRTAAVDDPAAAVAAWSEVQEAGLKSDLTRALADGFRDAGVGPKELAQWLIANAPERSSVSVRGEALARLAESDPETANDLLAGMATGQRDELRSVVAAMLEPAAAIEFARSIDRDDLKESSLRDVALRLGSTDPQSLYEAAEKDPDFARIAVREIVDSLAYEDINAAAEYVKSLPVDVRDPAADRLVERLSDIAPLRAMSLAATLIEDPEARRQAVAAAFATSVIDLGNAGNGNLPAIPEDGAARDEVLSAAVPLLAYRNPEMGLLVGNSIEQPDKRANAIQEVLLAIAQLHGPEAALNVLKGEIAVPAQVKSQIKEAIER